MTSLLFALILAAPANAELVEKTLAIVNSEVILDSDLKLLEKRIEKPGLVDESLLFDKPVDTLKHNKQSQLDYLINEKIIESEIKRLNLSISNERVESEFKDMSKKNNVSEVELENILKGQGIKSNEYKLFLKDKIEKQALMDSEIISKLRISDDDAFNEYLKNNPNSRPSINEFTVAHILLNPKKRGDAEAALKRAEEVLAKLKGGETFEVLAEQYSEDPNFSSGGALGTFKSGEFLPEIEESISDLKVGQTTGIVKSKLGYHIVKLTGKKLTPDPRFEKEKERLKSKILEYSFKRQLKIWLQNKKDEAFVRINE
jgi:peptidyl-prolyl cis-trans isomerase SurA